MKNLSFLLISLFSVANVFAQSKALTSINSTTPELKPLLSADGKTLYFVRSEHGANTGGGKAGQDVWKAEKSGELQFGEPKNIGAPINNPHHNAICGVSMDGKKIMLLNQYTTDNDMKVGLSTYTQKADGKFEGPKDYGFKGLSGSSRAIDVFLTTDANTMLMSMKSENGEHDDIYVALNQWGSWSTPINLGKTINTDGNEITPFLGHDGVSLFFSSNKHPNSKGGYDIYKSTRLDDTWTNWSIPVNVGPEVNGEGFDAYFLMTSDEKEAYFVSDKSGNEDLYGILKKDIFMLNDEETFVDDCAELADLKDDFANEQIAIALQINWCDEIEHEGAVTTDLTKEKKTTETAKEVKGQPFSALYFQKAKYNLDNTSKKTLEDLAKKMNAEPNTKIKISGFADKDGNTKDNTRLSMQRATEVLDYMVQKGIDPSRFVVVAFSDLKASEEIKDKDRKVELYIVQ